MIETELINLISNVGFPIAIAAWFIFKFEPKMNKLKETIDNNTKAFEKLCARLGDD